MPCCACPPSQRGFCQRARRPKGDARRGLDVRCQRCGRRPGSTSHRIGPLQSARKIFIIAYVAVRTQSGIVRGLTLALTAPLSLTLTLPLTLNLLPYPSTYLQPVAHDASLTFSSLPLPSINMFSSDPQPIPSLLHPRPSRYLLCPPPPSISIP